MLKDKSDFPRTINQENPGKEKEVSDNTTL